MDVLKQCDLFLTHAGLGSIVEAIFTSTPMLLFPLNELWDQNGNAARVVAKNMGRKGNLSFSVSQLSTEIEILLNDSHYKSATLALCELWKNKYKKNYFLKFLNH
jgi:UDP:flavonoid glycosyltransferase YjiC (YdhE family)